MGFSYESPLLETLKEWLPAVKGDSPVRCGLNDIHCTQNDDDI